MRWPRGRTHAQCSPPTSYADDPADVPAANLGCSELRVYQDAYGEAGAAGEASAAGLAIVPPLGAIAPLLGAASLPAPGLASAEAAGAELSGAVSSLF